MDAQLLKYDAFISYSTRADAKLARKIEVLLESFHKLPESRALQLPGLKVCMDEADFSRISLLKEDSGKTYLPKLIKANLETSGNLIVLCSYDSPKSIWQSLEVEWFLETHRPENVFLLITDGDPLGDPNRIFPDVIAKHEVIQSLPWFDIRNLRNREVESGKDATQELIRLACDIFKISSGEVYPRWARLNKAITDFKYILLALIALIILVTCVSILTVRGFGEWKTKEMYKVEKKSPEEEQWTGQMPIALHENEESIIYSRGYAGMLGRLSLSDGRSHAFPSDDWMLGQFSFIAFSANQNQDFALYGAQLEQGRKVFFIDADKTEKEIKSLRSVELRSFQLTDANQLIYSTDKSTIRMCDIESEEVFPIANLKPSLTTLIQFDPVSNLVAFNVIENPLMRVAGRPGNDEINTSIKGSKVRVEVWDLRERRKVGSFPLGSIGAELDMQDTISINSGTVALRTSNREVQVLRYTNGKLKHLNKIVPIFGGKVSKEESGRIEAIALDREGKKLAVYGDELSIFDVDTSARLMMTMTERPAVLKQFKKFISGGNKAIFDSKPSFRSMGRNIGFSERSKYLSVQTGAFINIYDASTGVCIGDDLEHHTEVSASTFITEGSCKDSVISECEDGTFYVWPKSYESKPRFLFGGPATTIAVNRQETLFCSGHNDGSIMIWRFPTGLIERKDCIAVATEPIDSLEFGEKEYDIWIRTRSGDEFRFDLLTGKRNSEPDDSHVPLRPKVTPPDQNHGVKFAQKTIGEFETDAKEELVLKKRSLLDMIASRQSYIALMEDGSVIIGKARRQAPLLYFDGILICVTCAWGWMRWKSIRTSGA